MKTLSFHQLILLFSVILLTGFNKQVYSQTQQSSDFAKVADISWLPQMEVTGYKFYNDNGTEEDCFKILKDHGIKDFHI